MIDLEDLESTIVDRFGEGGTRWKVDLFELQDDPNVRYKVRILVEPKRLFPVKLGGTWNSHAREGAILESIQKSIAKACATWPMRDPLWLLEDEEWDVRFEGRVKTMLGLAHSLAGWMGDPGCPVPPWWSSLVARIREEMTA